MTQLPAWASAPIPPWWHRCRAVTSGEIGVEMIQVDRCACGGIRFNGGRWFDRNSRRWLRKIVGW